MLTVSKLRRVETWSGYRAAGGARTSVFNEVNLLRASEDLDGTRTLTLAIPLTSPNLALLRKRAIVVVDQDDTPTFDEWRVVTVVDDRQSGLRTATCADIRTTDLAEAPPVMRVDSDGVASLKFESVTLTPAQHIATWVLPALAAGGMSYVSAGTITPTGRIDLTMDWSSPLSVLLTIAEKTGMELDIRRTGSTGYVIDLVPKLGSAAAIVDLRFGRNLTDQLRHEENSLQQATRLYPKGAGDADAVATISRAVWQVTAIAGTTITLADPAGGAGPIGFDNQLVNNYLRTATGTLTLVSASSAAAQTVTVASASGLAVNDLIQFRATAAGADLTYLDNPAALASDGLKVGTLERGDIPGTNNLVRNSMMRTWTGTLPANFTSIGTPTVTKTVAAPFTRYGGQSAKLDTTTDGHGFITDAVPIFPTALNPYVSGFGLVWGVSGTVRVELVLTTPGGTKVVPISPNVASLTQLGQWDSLGVSGIDANALGATAAQIRVVQHGVAAASFYLDGAQITQSPTQQPLVEVSGGTSLWQEANVALATTALAATSYDVPIIDLAQLDPVSFGPDTTIVLGAVARVNDPTMGIANVFTRIAAYQRDYLQRGQTTVTLSTRPSDLTGALAATERAVRVATDATPVASPGPSLDVVATPGTSSYSITYSASAAVQLSISGGAYATAPASPITVTRPAAGGTPLEYSFRVVASGQTVVDSVTIQPIDKNTVTPDLSVTPSSPTATQQSFSFAVNDPSGTGLTVSTFVTLIGTTGTVGASSVLDGVEFALNPGDVVVVNRPAFGTTAQASATFRATITGGGTERIQRSILTQVKTTFGPNLDVRATPGSTSYSLVYVGTATVQLSIDGGAYSAAPASPIVVTRPAAGASSRSYAFQTTADGQTVTNEVTIPAIDQDTNTVTPDLVVVPSAPAATTQTFTTTTSNPSGGTAPTLQVRVRGTTATLVSFGPLADGTLYTITSGDVVIVDRPAFGTTAQASVEFTSTIAGGGVERIQRSIMNQVKTTFGPNLDVRATPSSGSYSLAYTGSGTVQLSIDGGAYSAAAASPITVTRPAAGAASRSYAFQATADGETITNTVTIPAVDQDTITPDLVVTPAFVDPNYIQYAVSASNPTGGTLPNIYARIDGSTGSFGPSGTGTALSDGVEALVSTGGGSVVVTAGRAPFGTTAQPSITFRAAIAGGGTERIQRTIQNIVKTTFGPNLDVKATASPLTYSLAYSGSGTVQLSINGAAYSAAPASPIVVNRPLPGQTALDYTFQSTLDGQSVTNAVSVLARADDTRPGLEINSNPEFDQGLPGKYDNTNTTPSALTLTAVSDTSAPNGSGKLTRLTVAAGVVQDSTVSPGYGGFYLGFGPDSGQATLNEYHRGAVLRVLVRANIPVGYTLGYATNAFGTGGTSEFLTQQGGTGAYFDYVVAINVGTTGTFSPIIYFYISGPTGGNFVWDVAIASVRDLNQSEAPVVVPDLSVTPSNPATTTQDFTVSAINPTNGIGPAIDVTVRGTTGVYDPAGINFAMGDGTNYTGIVNPSLFRINRPPFGTLAQASVTFRAVLPGGGAERIQRTIQNQVKTTFGPTLDVATTHGATTSSIAYSASGTVTLSINGGTRSTAPASPIVVTRPAAGAASLDYSLQTTLDGQTITTNVLVPSVDQDTVTPSLTVTPGAITATTIAFTMSAINPQTGAAVTIVNLITDSSSTVPGVSTFPANTLLGLNSSQSIVVDRPAFGTATQATITFWATIGNAVTRIQRTIPSQVKTSFGPSLVVTPTPSSANYSLAYSGTWDTIVLSIDGGTYSTPAASPIVVTRGSADKVYTFKATRDGVDVVQAITVPAVAATPGTGYFASLSQALFSNATDQVDLNWTWSGSSAYFQVYVRENGGAWGSYGPTATGATSYRYTSTFDLNTNISPSVTIEFKVRAITASNNIMITESDVSPSANYGHA